MSDEAKPAKSSEDALLGLTSLDFGPAWARSGGDKKKGGSGEAKGKRQHDDRGERGDSRRRDDRGGGGGQRRDNRGGGGGQRRDDRGGGGGQRRDDRGGGGGQRRDDRGGGGGQRRDDRGGGRGQGRFDNRDRSGRGGQGRRGDDRGREREEIPPPDGFTSDVMPVEDGLDGLAKEILAGGRTYSVFDLSKLVMGARERFNVSFRTKKEGGMFRCKNDGSLWLTKEEAIAHFWNSDWRKDYYEEVVSSADPPQGNFQTVARCGLSGEWLGPPNYHGYQPAIMQLHRERFSHMSLENYKYKVKMERGEEAVAAWLDKMSKRIVYRPTGGVKAEEAAPSEESSASQTEEAPDEEAPAAPEVAPETSEATPATEEAEPTAETVEASEAAAEETVDPAGDAPEEPAAEEAASPVVSDEPALEDKREVDRHFVENHFDDAFQRTNRAWVNGNVPGNHLSPGLLTLLRQTVAEERRYPGKLTPMLCRQLSGRHVAVFKWRRKLKAGPSRPHPVPTDIAIADRPMALLNWITENSGKKLEHLWGALLPKEVSDEEKRGWYHDLHWLLNQGYVLLMADSTVHRAKNPNEGADGPAKKAKTKKARRERAEAKAAAESKPAESKPAESKIAESKPAEKAGGPDSTKEESESAIVSVTLGGTSGLYAMGGRTLSGAPKSIEALTGRGLWPSIHRYEAALDDEGAEPSGDELPEEL